MSHARRAARPRRRLTLLPIISAALAASTPAVLARAAQAAPWPDNPKGGSRRRKRPARQRCPLRGSLNVRRSDPHHPMYAPIADEAFLAAEFVDPVEAIRRFEDLRSTELDRAQKTKQTMPLTRIPLALIRDARKSQEKE